MTATSSFTASDDCPHLPGPDPTWQESALFTWYDLNAGLGGFLRLGHEATAGAVNSCFGVFTDDGLRFRSNVTGVALVAGDRGETHMGWAPHIRVDFDGPPRIKVDFDDCSAELRFDDFHPWVDYGSLSASGHLAAAAHHFEVAGRVTGRVRIGKQEFAIDALGHRDRSWSNRDWTPIRSTRWWPCVFGPDLSVHVIHTLRAPNPLQKLGYVWRDGKVIPAVDSEILVHLESDAITPRRGELRMQLADGDEISIFFNRRDGIGLHVRGYTAVETIGTAELNGRIGMSNLEVCTNAAGGSLPPSLAIGSNFGEGLSRRK